MKSKKGVHLKSKDPIRLEKGRILVRNDEHHKIIYCDEESIVTLRLSDGLREAHDLMEFMGEPLEPLAVLVTSHNHRPTQAPQYTDAQRSRVNYKKPYATYFMENTVRDKDCDEIIERIYAESGHKFLFPNKRKPSRASCFRWGKCLRDQDGDERILANG